MQQLYLYKMFEHRSESSKVCAADLRYNFYQPHYVGKALWQSDGDQKLRIVNHNLYKYL